MTPIFTIESFTAYGKDQNLAYVRPVKGYEIINDLSPDARQFCDLDPDGTFYAVHSADGQRLALHDDRNVALYVAQKHDYRPMLVH